MFEIYFQNPNYDSNLVMNDLALIELTQSVTMSANVSTVCVNQQIKLRINDTTHSFWNPKLKFWKK
jgi:hypothetical protein